MLRRAKEHLGPRFADYVVGDGEYATAPFLHTAGAVGLPVVARLKENLPLLATAGRGRMDRQHAALGEAVKDLYVYPLCRHVAERLRSSAAPVWKEREEEASRWRG